jgi:hypothetical protein
MNKSVIIFLIVVCVMLRGVSGLYQSSNTVMRGLVQRYRGPLALHMATKVENKGIINQMQVASIASAAAIAAAAVNAAVSMRPLSAPDSNRSFVSKDSADPARIGKVDEVGLPLIYDKALIEEYWKKQGSALTSRWTEFLGYSVPFLTKVITLLVTGGGDEVKANGATLAKDARIIMEKLVSS